MDKAYCWVHGQPRSLASATPPRCRVRCLLALLALFLKFWAFIQEFFTEEMNFKKITSLIRYATFQCRWKLNRLDYKIIHYILTIIWGKTFVQFICYDLQHILIKHQISGRTTTPLLWVLIHYFFPCFASWKCSDFLCCNLDDFASL